MARCESGDIDRRYAKKRWLVASAALAQFSNIGLNRASITYIVQFLYAASKPLPVSTCSNAHHPAYLESFLPPSPLDLPCAAIAARRSKKSKIILVRASESTLRGMNVENASRANCESGPSQTNRDITGIPRARETVPCSPTLKSS